MTVWHSRCNQVKPLMGLQWQPSGMLLSGPAVGEHSMKSLAFGLRSMTDMT